MDRLLAAAGLTDGADRWVAPARTALVITGDVVDRGPDTLGLVRRLASLREQASSAGGVVAILEGNHEAQVLGGLGGEPGDLQGIDDLWRRRDPRVRRHRPDEWEGRSAAEIAARVAELAPDLVPTLWTFAPYARWGDVLLVHGGPVPHQEPGRFERSADRLWIRDGFFASPDLFPDAEAWAPYRRAGIRRVVFGHTPVDRPTLSHEGCALNLDTWRSHQVTLARLEPGRSCGRLPSSRSPPNHGRSPMRPSRRRWSGGSTPSCPRSWTPGSRPPGADSQRANAWGNCAMMPSLSMSAISRISAWTRS